MRPALSATFQTQGGIFARHQALASGYSKQEFDRLTRAKTGVWRRIRYGIYTMSEFWDGLDDTERWLLADRAALLVCDSGTVLSHSSAARRHGFDLYGVDDGLTHVTRIRTHGRFVNRTESAVKHHSGALDESEIRVINGVAVTAPARTVVDVTAEFGYRAGLVVADSALRAGLSKLEVADLVEQMATYPSAPTLRAVVDDSDARSESALETLSRVLLREIGVADVEPQFVIKRSDSKTAWVDLYSRALHHVFECDGKKKYVAQLDDRGNALTPQDIVWLEKKREDDLRGQGFGFSRITWPDIATRFVERVGRRLWREIRKQNASGVFPPQRP